MKNLNEILKAAKKKQADASKIVAAAEKEMQKKRQAEKDAKQADENQILSIFKALDAFKGLPVSGSVSYSTGGGFRIAQSCASIIPSRVPYCDPERKKGLKVFASADGSYSKDGLEVVWEKGKGFEIRQSLFERKTLLRYEDLEADKIWQEDPAKVVVISTPFANKVIEYITEFLISVLDLEEIAKRGICGLKTAIDEAKKTA